MKFVKFKNKVFDYYSDCISGHVNSIYKGWNPTEQAWYIGQCFKDEKIGIWRRVNGCNTKDLSTYNGQSSQSHFNNYYGIKVNFNRNY